MWCNQLSSSGSLVDAGVSKLEDEVYIQGLDNWPTKRRRRLSASTVFGQDMILPPACIN
jgi:hypothetical protein